MRAKEFIIEYMNYSPVRVDAQHPDNPMHSAVDRVAYLLQKGEARDPDHALKIVSSEAACELDMDPTEVRKRLKKLL